MAKNKKSVSEKANPESKEENELRSLSRTRSDKRVPIMPKTEMVVKATPSI